VNILLGKQNWGFPWLLSRQANSLSGTRTHNLPSRQLVAKGLHRFGRQFPEIEVELEIGIGPRLFGMVETQELDFAIGSCLDRHYCLRAIVKISNNMQ
jgi:DNA-binding transcriptional LysR family regulator